MFLNNMIKISGNSNYKVSVVKTDKLYIIKEGFTKEDTLRLQKQIEKQERFSESNKYTIKTAKIINKDNTRYTMEYIKSYDMINYLNTVEFNSIKNMINNIVKLVNTFIKESDMIIIEKSLIINKLNSINENLQRYHKNSIVIECINYLYENINIFEKEIPIGACHGDLTLSNMIITKKKSLIRRTNNSKTVHVPCISLVIIDVK
jgi:thiamine kinase-like enzyme